MKQQESDCRCSKVEQDIMNTILLRQINQNDNTGVYVASKEEMVILKIGQKKRYVIQMNYLIRNSTANQTSNQGRSYVSDGQTHEPIQEKKRKKQVASNCRSSEKAQKSMNNKLSRKINQYDAADGVYCVPRETFEIVRAAHQKRLAHQKNYYIIDNDTGNERIYPK